MDDKKWITLYPYFLIVSSVLTLNVNNLMTNYQQYIYNRSLFQEYLHGP